MADESSTEEFVAVVSVPSPGQDHYTVLGVSHSASEKQITLAYKKLSLKYHPDRNPDDDEAKAIYQLVSTAYQTLVDPSKRKDYDAKLFASSHVDVIGEAEAVSPSAAAGAGGNGTTNSILGLSIGKAFGKAIERLSLKGSTLSQEIFDIAHNMAKCGDLETGGPPLDPRLSDLPFGWAYDMKVDRQLASFYRISLDENHVSNGFFIRCKSSNKGKFRVLVLDKEGKLLLQEESHRGVYEHSVTEVTLFFTNFETYQFVDPSLVSVASTASVSTTTSASTNSSETVTDFGVPGGVAIVEKDILPIFNRLRGFVPAKRSLPVGQYLICIYGENVIGKSHVQLVISASNNDLLEVREILEADAAVRDGRVAIENLKDEYLQAKAAFDLATKKINAEADRIDSLLTSRDASYKGFLDKSANAYSPSDEVAPPAHGLFASFTAAASAAAATTIKSASSVAASAISAASAAASSKPATAASVDSEKEETAPIVGQSESSAPAVTAAAAAAPTSPNTSTSSAVHFLFANSKATAATAATTATVAGGWFAKQLSVVGYSLSKAAMGDKEKSDSSHAATSTASAGVDASAAADVAHQSSRAFVVSDDAPQEGDEVEDVTPIDEVTSAAAALAGHRDHEDDEEDEIEDDI